MNRKETTKFLTDILIQDRLSDRKYYAREVTLDYGTAHPRHVDIMEFRPAGVTYCSDIEKGTFICYEIKSCKADVFSGKGLNFYGEQNYIVTTMKTYKELIQDKDKLEEHVKEFMGVKVCPYFGFMVPVPAYIDLRDTKTLGSEFENPSELDPEENWKMWTVTPGKSNSRLRSMNELLFCMLRAKHSQTNQGEIAVKEPPLLNKEGDNILWENNM